MRLGADLAVAAMTAEVHRACRSAPAWPSVLAAMRCSRASDGTSAHLQHHALLSHLVMHVCHGMLGGAAVSFCRHLVAAATGPACGSVPAWPSVLAAMRCSRASDGTSAHLQH